MANLSRLIISSALDLTDVRPGDIGVAHSKGVIGWLIRVGTRSYWNHAFVIETSDGTGNPEGIGVIQAEAHGVLRAKLSDVAPGGSYAILSCPKGVERELVVAEAQKLLRDKYAFISIASIAFNLLLPLPIRLNVYENGTLICSAVTALALLAGGWLHQWPDLYQVTPAQIGTALCAPLQRTKPVS